MGKPNIVVLDGHCLNPGDLTWDGLKALGNVKVYPRTTPDQVLARAKGANLVFVNKVVLSEATLKELSPTLKFIGVLATGYNVIDVAAARKYDIVVSNIPTYGTMSVAQSVFAHLLNITNSVASHAAGVKKLKWTNNKDWCYWDGKLLEMSGRTMGIVGFGRIGQASGRIAQALGMKVIAHDTMIKKSPLEGVEMVSLDRLCRESDVITLHCFLTPENTGMINASFLRKMKRSAIVINTSRGQLVNEKDLANALNSGTIAAAGLDVLNVEPPKGNNPLLKAKNCFVTPHIAWATHEARDRLMNIAVDNARNFLQGNPTNDVRPKL